MNVMIVSDKTGQNQKVNEVLVDYFGVKTYLVTSICGALEALKKHWIDLVVSDGSLADGEASVLINYAKKNGLAAKFILITDHPPRGGKFAICICYIKNNNFEKLIEAIENSFF